MKMLVSVDEQQRAERGNLADCRINYGFGALRASRPAAPPVNRSAEGVAARVGLVGKSVHPCKADE